MRWFFSSNSADQKGVAWHIQNDDGGTYVKEILPGKVAIQNWGGECFSDEQKLKEDVKLNQQKEKR